MAANNYFFVAKNGLAVGNTTNIKQVVNSSGQWIGDPTGVIQNSYDQANLAITIASSGYNHSNAAYDQANTADILAQAAFDKANTPSTNSFSTIYVTGSSDDLEATSPNTALTFVPSGGVIMGIDKPNNAIGISVMGGMQGVTMDWGFVYEPVVAYVDFGSL